MMSVILNLHRQLQRSVVISLRLIGVTLWPSKQRELQESCFKSFMNWILSFVLIKDEDILRKKGLDAIQYLVFQRYIIYLLSGISVICLVIILPIHLTGERLKKRDDDDKHYQKTTILNIENNSRIAWIHVLMAIIIVIMVHSLLISLLHLISGLILFEL